MKNKSSDRFEGGTNPITQENFFLTGETSSFDNYQLGISEPNRRLNDYDFNLLQEDAYKDISDDLFKIEYKISKTENELKGLEIQIQNAKEINDATTLKNLIIRQSVLNAELQSLLASYNQKSLSAKIADSLLGIFGIKFKNNPPLIKQKFSNLSNKLISKLPKNLISLLELKDSLIRLENLNKSVDELVNMNIPYGENIDKYEQLSKYIIKANSIQSKISQQMKKNS